MMKKELKNPTPSLKETVRKVRDTRFALNRVRLMHGLSAVMVILMVSTIALTMSSQTKTMTDTAPQTPDQTIEQNLAEDQSMNGRIDETVALELLDVPELDDYGTFSRSMDSQNLIDEEVTAEVTAAPVAPAEVTAAPIAPAEPAVVSNPMPTPKPTAAPIPKPTAKPTPKPVAKPAAVAAPAPTTTSSSLTAAQRQAIINLAKAQVGKRYVFGAMSPKAGFDCSGLTSYIYKSLFNVYLPHSARDQSKKGVAVSKSNIQAGDIICFDWSSPRGVVDHVGIYIGGGQYIHASASRGKVVQSTINFSSNPITTIRRIIH